MDYNLKRPDGAVKSKKKLYNQKRLRKNESYQSRMKNGLRKLPSGDWGTRLALWQAAGGFEAWERDSAHQSLSDRLAGRARMGW